MLQQALFFAPKYDTLRPELNPFIRYSENHTLFVDKRFKLSGSEGKFGLYSWPKDHVSVLKLFGGRLETKHSIFEREEATWGGC
jgi:hypothetical protein